MRAIWSGAIGFGLVNIPVKMYSATESSNLDLDMLDKHDNANIRFKRVNENTGAEVAYGDIVKGYKINNKYVVLDEEDFEEAAPKKSQVIEIEEFIPASEIEPYYYETPFYLAPDEKGAGKAYVLLRDALEETEKIAIGTYVSRGREHLCALRPEGNTIVLFRLRFAEEIRDTSELDLPSNVTIKKGEMESAVALINHLTPKKFNIEKYKDTYHADLMKVIKAKAKGRAHTEPKFKLVKSKAGDLMADLKASLEESKPRRKRA